MKLLSRGNRILTYYFAPCDSLLFFFFFIFISDEENKYELGVPKQIMQLFWRENLERFIDLVHFVFSCD